MKPRLPLPRSASSTKSGVTRRQQLAPVVRGPWSQVMGTGAREFASEAGLTSSGGDFGFPAPASEPREAR
jgi:hypothetical protein